MAQAAQIIAFPTALGTRQNDRVVMQRLRAEARADFFAEFEELARDIEKSSKELTRRIRALQSLDRGR